MNSPAYRIIPARAGFTHSLVVRCSALADHPRSRGVYKGHQGHGVVKTGSSPLARGLQYQQPPQRRRPRIIPARAGFTEQQRAGRHRRGIIPARAGFTVVVVAVICAPRDHPRSRGVYQPSRRGGGRQHGSSPLARGLRRPHRGPDRQRGIIPARAGFTLGWHGGVSFASDHPRSRGVYIPFGHRTPTSTGSSPLARGLHLAILGIPTMPDPTRRLLPSLLT